MFYTSVFNKRSTGRFEPHCRIIWIVLVLFGIGSLINMLVDLFDSYHKYPFKTVVRVTPTDHLPFPAVTICNLNSFEVSHILSNYVSIIPCVIHAV